MVRSFVLIIMLAAVLTVPAARAQPVGLDIYLLIGQSNMSGRDSPIALPSFDAADRIWIFSNAWTWRNPAYEPVDDPDGQQLSIGIDWEAGASPALAFAQRMVELTGRPVGLVPCAKGGSSIADWRPSYSYWSLYGACLAAARRASPAGRIRGALIWQGESDARSLAAARAWPAAFSDLVQSLRADLAAPDLPIVFAQISADPIARWRDFLGWDELQKQQWGMRDEGLAMIKTQDLPVLGDELHVTADGMVEAGYRFAEAMVDLIQ